jgi:hypothetical protein
MLSSIDTPVFPAFKMETRTNHQQLLLPEPESGFAHKGNKYLHNVKIRSVGCGYLFLSAAMLLDCVPSVADILTATTVSFHRIFISLHFYVKLRSGMK